MDALEDCDGEDLSNGNEGINIDAKELELGRERAQTTNDPTQQLV